MLRNDVTLQAGLETLRAALPRPAGVEWERGAAAQDDGEGGRGAAGAEGWLRLQGAWGRLRLPFREQLKARAPGVFLLDQRMREATVDAVRQGGPAPAEPSWILLTDHVAPSLARRLREEGIAFADTCGNAHVWAPGLYVWVVGNPPRTRRARTPRLGRAAAARVLFALLQEPKRIHGTYRDLADQAGVALDTVHQVFTDLKAKAQLKMWGGRERALTRPVELLELWAQAYGDALRPKLEPTRCDWVGEGAIERLLQMLPAGHDAPRVLLGGEVAAAALTGAIRPTAATLHVEPGAQGAVMKALRLVPRPDGAITLLHTFGRTNEWPAPRPLEMRLVDPLLIHAELLLQDDDRAMAAAREIHDRYIVQRFEHERLEHDR